MLLGLNWDAAFKVDLRQWLVEDKLLHRLILSFDFDTI